MSSLMRPFRNFSHAFTEYGVAGLFDFIFWICRTYYEKLRIQTEDRLGLFTYATWLKEHGDPSPATITESTIPGNPLASFLIFIRKADSEEIKDLEKTLNSIAKQNISNWECILIHSPVTSLNDQPLFNRWISDPRVSTHAVDGIKGRGCAILAGLPFIRGKWIIWTRPGDIHAEELLSQLLPVDDEIAYWDEDIVGIHGTHSPFLKPDWSPELWLSIDLLYCSAIQTHSIRELPATKDCEQIISLGISEAKRIVHIPAILSHCRLSAWENQEELRDHMLEVKNYLLIAGIKNSEIRQKPDGSLKVSWPIESKKISIIIPNKNNYSVLHKCIQSILEKSYYRNYEIIIVDDFSTEESVQNYYQELKNSGIAFQVVHGTSPFNFSRACNIGARAASGVYLLFLNNDTEVISSNWLNELALFASVDEIGVVGGKLLFPDRTVQHAGIILGMEGHASHVFAGSPANFRTPYGSIDWYRDFSAVTGACMMMRKHLYEEIGGFDERLSLVFNDVDICLRSMDHGYRVVYNPEVLLLHHEGKSRGKYIPGADIQLGYERFAERIRHGDPFYNKNLSLAWRIPTLKRAWEQPAIERLQKIVRYF